MNLEIMTLVLSLIDVLLSIAVFVGICIYIKKGDKQKDKTEDYSEKIQKNFSDLRAEQRTSLLELSNMNREQIRAMSEQINQNLKDHTETVDKNLNNQIASFDQKFKELTEREERSIVNTENRLDKIENRIKENLSDIRKDNESQLTQMREVVDEKLNRNLEEKLKNSFSLISEQLEKVHKGLSEMDNLSSGVNNLSKVLNGVKTRGTWGETSLQGLIEDILIPEQYSRNVKIKDDNAVEFCIKLPGNGDPVLLPIDSKFPLADYSRLVESSQNCDVQGINASKKALESCIKKKAKEIDKYIEPPKTTDFAIMYLPIEGLYAEITKNVELVENIRREQKIIIAGPSTLAALLNSLQVGFRTLAIQKNSLQIQNILVSFKHEFAKFVDLLSKSGKQASALSDTIQKVLKQTDSIDKKLKGIEGSTVGYVSDESSDASDDTTDNE